MPKKDDTAARVTRARLLRMQITQLVSEDPGAARAPGEPSHEESPREFIERRMRELEAESRKKGARPVRGAKTRKKTTRTPKKRGTR